MASASAAVTASGPPSAGVGRRASPRIRWVRETTTAWILVPPRSIPPRRATVVARRTRRHPHSRSGRHRQLSPLNHTVLTARSRRGAALGGCRGGARDAVGDGRSGTHGRQPRPPPDARWARLRRLRHQRAGRRRADRRGRGRHRLARRVRGRADPAAGRLGDGARRPHRGHRRRARRPDERGRHHHRRRQQLLPRRHRAGRPALAPGASTTSTSGPAVGCTGWSGDSA